MVGQVLFWKPRREPEGGGLDERGVGLLCAEASVTLRVVGRRYERALLRHTFRVVYFYYYCFSLIYNM